MHTPHGLCYGWGSPLDLIQRRLLRAGHGVLCFAKELISYYRVDYILDEELLCVGGIETSGIERLKHREVADSALRQEIGRGEADA